MKGTQRHTNTSSQPLGKDLNVRHTHVLFFDMELWIDPHKFQFENKRPKGFILTLLYCFLNSEFDSLSNLKELSLFRNKIQDFVTITGIN